MKKLEEYGKVLKNVDLQTYNTYRLPSSCNYMFFPNDVCCLIKALKYLKKENITFFMLGNGSNVILPNKNFEGVIIKLDNLTNIKINDNVVNCEAGVLISHLVRECINNNLKGLEWAIGIPGTVGGCVFNNAGAYKSEIFDFIENVKVLDEFYNIKILNKTEIKYSYRNTMFKKNKKYIIIEVELKLMPGNKEESNELIIDRAKRRVATQPIFYPNAGSVFRNPKEQFAGKLIEDLGLKNYHVNDAYISEKHANFIINKGSSTSDDIIKLIKIIKNKIKKEYNIDLICEQEIVKW